MSYHRSYRRTVAVRYSGTISYPASQSGGTKSYSGTAYEDIDIDIYVDTNDFDRSINNCNNTVNGLTASIGAMNAAQCKAIQDNADKVSKSIIDGFFLSVKTDLQTQKAELEQVIESRLVLLRQQAESLREKQKNMSEDYARTSARYQKIFNDINNELSVRIHQIDQPIFDLVKDVDSQSDRMLHTDMVQTAVTFNKECGTLQSQINVALVKKHALSAMTQATNFLISKANSEATLQKTSLQKTDNDTYFIPSCYMETKSEDGRIDQKCLVPQKFSNILAPELCKTLSKRDLGSNTEDESKQIKSYFEDEIANKFKDDDSHSSRVKAMIYQMFNK